jgi:hypothetical protein
MNPLPMLPGPRPDWLPALASYLGSQKISQMPTAMVLVGGELVPIVQNGDNVHCPVSWLYGAPGPSGLAASITVDGTSTLHAGAAAYVSNLGTSQSALFEFGIPQGPQGLTGPAGSNGTNGADASVSVLSTSTLLPGNLAYVVNSGTSQSALLNFGIPQGFQGNNGSDGTDGTNGTNGSNGANASIAIGNVSTLLPTQNAFVTNSGTSVSAILNFGIPAGPGGAGFSEQRTHRSAGNTGNVAYTDAPNTYYEVGVAYLAITVVSPSTILGSLHAQLKYQDENGTSRIVPFGFVSPTTALAVAAVTGPGVWSAIPMSVQFPGSGASAAPELDINVSGVIAALNYDFAVTFQTWQNYV